MTTKNDFARREKQADSDGAATASAVRNGSAHTPGPWKVVGPIGWIMADDPYGRGQMLVGQVRGWGHLTGRGGGCAFDEEKSIAIQDANARLIAAAPELLAALKAMMDGSYGNPACPDENALVEEQAAAAIAKAEHGR